MVRVKSRLAPAGTQGQAGSGGWYSSGQAATEGAVHVGRAEMMRSEGWPADAGKGVGFDSVDAPPGCSRRRSGGAMARRRESSRMTLHGMGKGLGQDMRQPGSQAQIEGVSTGKGVK